MHVTYACVCVCVFVHAPSHHCLRPARIPSSSSTAEPPITEVEQERQDRPDHD